jgi:hypothetical protein
VLSFPDVSVGESRRSREMVTQVAVITRETLKFTGILKEITDEGDLSPVYFKYGDPLVVIRLSVSVNPAIHPVDCGSAALNYFPLDMECQFRVLAKQDPKKPYNLPLPEKWPCLGEIEFGSFGEEPLKPIQVSGVHEIEELVNRHMGHRKPSG